MPTKIEILLDKIKTLENELIEELQKHEEEFAYEIRKRKVYFAESITARQRQYVKRLSSYLSDAPIGHILSVPFIWLCLLPMLILDGSVSLYQSICFPIYGIPKVNRQDYLIYDRKYLSYLNTIEKINCTYCSYANGLFAYFSEIAGRTEQFWCPIKHASRLKTLHSRYQKFIAYGDAETYHTQLEVIRRNFKDIP